jgi:hypothetical protein
MAVSAAPWTDSWRVLRELRNKASDRKLRLFACACARRLGSLFTDQACRRAVEVAERLADHQARPDEVIAAEGALRRVQNVREELPVLLGSLLHESGEDAAHRFLGGCSLAASAALAAFRLQNPRHTITEAANTWLTARDTDRARLGGLLADLFFDRFQNVRVQRAWQTEIVVSLAQGIYEERAFDRMAILGDALEDAGCASALVLDHCRQPREHARGCWVVDGILDKE